MADGLLKRFPGTDAGCRSSLRIACFCFLIVACAVKVESAASKNEGLLKTTYLNETINIHAPGVAEEYRDKLVIEQLKIIIESEKGSVVHYVLPFDEFRGQTIVNPSQLDASVSGNVISDRGISRYALEVNGRDNFIRVTGPGHRSECFGDLDRCSLGYTLSFWINFKNPVGRGEHVYLSNGGHHDRSHGVAMLYNHGNLEFRFKKKNGQEWRAKSNNILPERWYHVLATWRATEGLMLYINGELVDRNNDPVERSPLVGNVTDYNEFLIGRPNDRSYVTEKRPISIDEFNFWSEFKTSDEVKELGPMYRYYLPMDHRPGLNVEDGNMKVAVGGNPSLIRGKIRDALAFDGRGDFISGDDQSTTCLGDLTLCQYGLVVGTWIRFDDLRDAYILSTGNKGIKLYLRDNHLVAEAQQGSKHWMTTWSRPETGRWHFIELVWNPNDGLSLFADLKEVARASSYRTREPSPGTSNLNIGKSGMNQENERYASIALDDLEMWYGERNQLIGLDFLARGRPVRHYISMDATSYNRITHPNITIEMYGQPKIVSGKINGALNLDGNSQYVSLGNQHDSCFGNLDLCRHGLLFSTWIQPGQLREGMDILTTGSNGINAWYSGGQLRVSARTLTREWNVQTDRLASNQWHFVEFGWDPVEGLYIYINDHLVAQDTNPKVRSASDLSSSTTDHERFYFGRGDGSRSNARYGNMTIDDVEYWYNNRRYLLAFDYIRRGKPTRYHFDMDAIRENKLVHSSLNIPAHGTPVIVSGKVNGAIRFDGNRQYLDVGDQTKNCLGNMEYCDHGLTGSMWINFRSLLDRMYVLSSGGGLRIFYYNGRLWVEVNHSGRRWEVGIPDLKTDTWYFLEYTWHPGKGLQVYLNNKFVGETKQGIASSDSGAGGRYLIGSGNSADGQFRYADAIIDDMETWFMDREDLVANGYLIRDNITHISFPFQNQRGNTIIHSDYTIIMYNGAVLVRGHIGNGLQLGGRGEYVTFGDQRHNCMGNLVMCPRGLTISMYLNPRTLPNNGYILSAGPYSIYSKDGKIYAKFTSGVKTWEVETNKIQLNNWQQLEISWDEQKGLQLYVNKERVASTTNYITHPTPPRINDYTMYLGRPNEDQRGGAYADAKIDELEFWYANRDHLEVDDSINSVILEMEEISNERLPHPTLEIYIYGGRIVSGINGYGVLLNGHNQYIDVGREVFCRGNLDNCERGFTLRFKISPHQLIDNTYFVSSAPVDVYYQNNRLIAEVRTPSKIWTTSTGNIHPNTWYQVDLSWHPTDGLTMYVNGQQVSQQITGTRNYKEYIINKHFYIGRANTDMRLEYYADAVFDDVQVWEAKRDFLISIGVINPDIDDLSRWTTVRPRTTTTVTRRPRPPIHIPTNLPGLRRRLVFDRNEWIVYDFSQLPSSYLGRSDEERLTIKFQADRPDGLLWYTGDDYNNVHLTLKEGFLYFVSTRDGGRYVDRVRIASGRLDDGAWHDVVLSKRRNQVIVEIDRRQYPPHTIDYDFSLLRPYDVYLGGSERTDELTNYHISSNFYGRIREAILSGNSLPHDLDLKGLFLLHPRHVLVTHRGDIWDEDDVDDTPPPPREKRPVTFTTSHSYLRLPQWDISQSGTLELNFKTVEPHGLILFNGGSRDRKDFIAIEVYDGRVYLILNMGDGVQRFPFGTVYHTVDDGQPHYLRVDRTGNSLRLTIDADVRTHSIAGSDSRLDLDGVSYLGGVDHKERLPWHVWSSDFAGSAVGEDLRFFRGCMWDLKINQQESIDLESYVVQQGVTGIKFDCRTMPTECETHPCQNGTCIDRWGGFFCDCSETSYTGKRCELHAPLVTFNGDKYLRIHFQSTYRTHTNDISLRFKTPKANGLLFAAMDRRRNNYLNVRLENGQVKVETNLEGVDHPIIVQCHHTLSDNRWHTLHLKRRAHHLEAHVDDCTKNIVELQGEGYGLNIDDILVGKMGPDDSIQNSFIGHLQNFYFDRYQFFDYFLYGGQPADIRFGGDIINATLIEQIIPIFPVTFRANPNAFLVLRSLQIVDNTALQLMFRTKESSGLLLYNGGQGGDFFAMELVNGVLHVMANDGSGVKIVTSTAPYLSDNKWHLVEVVRRGPKIFAITVDKKYSSNLLLLDSGNTLDLTEKLYVGGLPENLLHRIHNIQSRKNFVGCLASFIVNGDLYNLMTDAETPSHFVTQGCSDASEYCVRGVCRHYGKCYEGVNEFICDCNMTSYVGRTCEDEAEGFRFGEQFEPGITIFRFPNVVETKSDNIALGFMTWNPNGTLIRIDSDVTADFIEARLVNGHVVVMYDLGGGIRYLNETRNIFNDGRYHYLVFTRTEDNATLRVDDYPVIHHYPERTGHVIFDGMRWIKIGGNLNEYDEIINYFNGIIAGVHVNNLRIIDLNVYYKDGRVTVRDDVIIAPHPFFVPNIRPPKPTREPPIFTREPPIFTDPPIFTREPPIITGPPVPPSLPPVPKPERGGGGHAWFAEDGMVVIGGPDDPRAEAIKIPPAAVAGAGVEEGARAAAVAGAMIGVLAAVSSVVWAFYKFKPGLIGVGGGSSGLVISSPTSTTTPLLAGTATGTGAAVGDGIATKTIVAASAGGGGGAGAGGGTVMDGRAGVVNLSEHFQSISSSTTVGGGGSASAVSGGGGSGTMHRGIQTDIGTGAGGAHDQNISSSTIIRRDIHNIYNVNQDAGYGTGQGMGTLQGQSGYGASGQMLQQGYNTMSSSSYAYDASQGFGQDRVDAGYGAGASAMGNLYEIQNMALGYSGFSQQELYNQQRLAHQRLVAASNALGGGPVPNLMAAEEIRVDCAKMTTNGRYVVTGSIFGPPQVWDLKTGDLVRVMKGEDFSSTDLHLANGDTLLVGQVAELEQINPADPTARSRLHHRKLQIWDFESGHALDMRRNELCTASCMMSDGERMLLGRTDKYGKNTVIIVWDILGNEPLRQITCDASVGFADYISYLNLSKDNRYVIAGFQNSHDHKANFITFDLSSSATSAASPKVMALDAQVEVTAILENHEAVTGTKGGELVIWSIRTGRELRQLVSPSTGTMNRMEMYTQPAHQAEVKDVVVSKDGQLLGSASADRTVKLWNMELEKLVHTLVGHTDEVWCCTISNDNELIASGSRDCTIRLWRCDDGQQVAAIDAGMDVFKVLLSNNKKTIVALADKAASRKLIMLKVVRTKMKGSSRATSPRWQDETY